MEGRRGGKGMEGREERREGREERREGREERREVMGGRREVRGGKVGRIREEGRGEGVKGHGLLSS